MKLYGRISELISAVFRKDTYEITLKPSTSVTYTGPVNVELPAKNGNAVLVSSGDIVNADINASAGIVDTKLATISTAGKVSNSATTATDANTPSAIVARDASGNFSAGTITASLSGNASTATTATSFSGSLSGEVTGTQSATVIASGVIDNDNISATAGIVDTKLATISTAGKVSNSATTATSANTASAIVARDGSGNFSAGTVSASGVNVSGLTASRAVVTDGSKNLASLEYTTAATGSTLVSRDVAGSTSVNTLTAANIDVTGLATMDKAYIDGPSGGGFVEFEGQTVGDVLAPTAGEARLFAGTDGKIYVRKKGSSQAEELGAGGSGEINLVDNSSDAGNWGVVNATATTNTTAANNPLSGTIDTSIAIASSTSGGYARYRFSMPSALKQRKLKLEWYQIASSLASGAYKVEVWTNAASDYSGAYTELALSTDSSGTSSIPNLNGKYSTTFDTNGSDYYEIRVVRTAASAATLYIANVVCGPGIQPQGAVVGEWVSYTPTTAGLGTLAASQFSWRRVGDSIQISGRGTTGSSISNVQVQFGLPSGLTVSSRYASITLVGKFSENAVNSSGYDFNILATANNSYLTLGEQSTNSGLTSISSGTGITFIPANQPFSFFAELAINEWAGSGTVQLAQNDVEFASNDGSGGTAANTAYNTGMVYGPAGSNIPAVASITGGYQTTSYKVAFQTPIQVSDILQLEILSPGKSWSPVANSVFAPSIRGTGYRSGIIIDPIDATSVYVSFGNGGAYSNNATFDAAGVAWSTQTSVKWRVRKSSAGAAVGFGIVSGSSAGLLPSSNSNLDDATATRLGLKQYLHGTNYNGGIAPTVSSPNATIGACRFIPYQLQDGGWRVRFNIFATYSPASTGATITVNGVVFNGGQAASITASAAAGCYADNGGGNIIWSCPTASNNVLISGDVALSSKPTWAY